MIKRTYRFSPRKVRDYFKESVSYPLPGTKVYVRSNNLPYSRKCVAVNGKLSTSRSAMRRLIYTKLSIVDKNIPHATNERGFDMFILVYSWDRFFRFISMREKELHG